MILRLENDELIDVNGGALTAASVGGIAVLVSCGITFLIGVIDGIVRPLTCHK